MVQGMLSFAFSMFFKYFLLYCLWYHYYCFFAAVCALIKVILYLFWGLECHYLTDDISMTFHLICQTMFGLLIVLFRVVVKHPGELTYVQAIL
jgi:hypothetical protein